MEPARVGEAGERVVRGLVRELVLERLELLVHLRVAQRRAGLGRAAARGPRTATPAARRDAASGRRASRHRRRAIATGTATSTAWSPVGASWASSVRLPDAGRRRRPASPVRPRRGPGRRRRCADRRAGCRAPAASTAPAGRRAGRRHRAFDLEHRRVGEADLADRGAQRVEHLVDVEAGAPPAAEPRPREQAAPPFGFVALAAGGGDLFDEVVREIAARQRDEEDDERAAASDR